jgi:hypothetical protein|tara:strand:+ start:111 stop:650 length:540 start_codon:yes stop_codon:yes gene_type:complete
MYNFIETYKIDPTLCDKLIDYHKKNKEYKTIGFVGAGVIDKRIKDSTDSSFYNSSNNPHIQLFFKQLSDKLIIYMEKYKIKENVMTDVCNNIQHYDPKAGYPFLHYERAQDCKSRQLVYMLYLNTVTDKGGTRFPYQKITTPATKGNLIIWPAEFTHPHHGIISKTQEKYIATGWFDIV